MFHVVTEQILQWWHCKGCMFFSLFFMSFSLVGVLCTHGMYLDYIPIGGFNGF